nr:hypothetical protein [Accumulibacter sp.]
MGELVFALQRREHRLPGGQETFAVARTQGFLHRGVGGDELPGHRQACRLLLQKPLPLAGHLGNMAGEGRRQLPLILLPQERRRAEGQQHDDRRQRRQQAPQEWFRRRVDTTLEDQAGNRGDQQGQHQPHGHCRADRHFPLPGAGIDVHGQGRDDLAAALVRPGGDDQIINPFDIGRLGLDLAIGRILVGIIDPAAPPRQSDVLDLLAEVLAPRPVLLVEQVVTDQFRRDRMRPHGHVKVVGKGVEIAPAKLALRVVAFGDETLAAILAIEVHGLAHHRLRVIRSAETRKIRLVTDRNPRRNPRPEPVGKWSGNSAVIAVEDGAQIGRRRIDLGWWRRLRASSCAVHQDEERTIGLAADQPQKPACRQRGADHGELLLHPVVVRALQIRHRPGQQTDALDIHRLRCQPGLLQQFAAQIAVGPPGRPPRRSGDQHDQHGASQPLATVLRLFSSCHDPDLR